MSSNDYDLFSVNGGTNYAERFVSIFTLLLLRWTKIIRSYCSHQRPDFLIDVTMKFP